MARLHWGVVHVHEVHVVVHAACIISLYACRTTATTICDVVDGSVLLLLLLMKVMMFGRLLPYKGILLLLLLLLLPVMKLRCMRLQLQSAELLHRQIKLLLRM